jgi:hypothetical protein
MFLTNPTFSGLRTRMSAVRGIVGHPPLCHRLAVLIFEMQPQRMRIISAILSKGLQLGTF